MAVSVAADESTTCQGFPASNLQAAVAASLHKRLVPVASSRLKIVLSGLSCDFKTVLVREESLNSTYVASQQQLTNPDYIRLQSELESARARLAQTRAQNAMNRTTSVWVGALQGANEGLAAGRVSELERQLGQTPPFILQPVILTYAPVTFALVKKALGVRHGDG